MTVRITKDITITKGDRTFKMAQTHDEVKDVGDFQQLTGETSLHGIRFVGNKDIATIRRCIWTVLLVSSLSMLGFAVYSSITKYYQYNSSSAITTFPNDVITFPAVTLCNYNQFRVSEMTERENSFFFSDYMDPSFNFTPYNDINFTATLLRISHRIEDMLINCSWQYRPCGPDDFSTKTYDLGVCYTFNGDSSNPLTTRNAGDTTGLILEIDINQTEYAYSANKAAGLKVLVHQQDEYPLVATFGFSVSPGFKTQVGLTGAQVVNLPHPYPSNCTSRALKYTKAYTETNCINECKYRYITEICECKHPTMSADVRDCTIEESIRCAFEEEVNFYNSGTKCDCPIACEQTFYNNRISTSYWPANYVLGDYLDKTGYTTKEDIRENLLQLQIYFEEMNFQIVTEVPTFSKLQLLSEIGGNMGLLCGMSLITIIEFLEFGFLSAIFRYCRFGKNNNAVDITSTK
ncbi:acid-sensing ion channel 1-like isoform X2 [Antedon mediterranea]|uniref:acid-sensing ion channel 1-like isoform X2 n=1 Tax=Antedon mediterranea TaxID=105859 RepID=UPI003AF52CE9